MTELVLQALFEVLEGQHHHSDVVKSLVRHRSLHNLLDKIATRLVDGLVTRMEALLRCDPPLFEDFGI